MKCIVAACALTLTVPPLGAQTGARIGELEEELKIAEIAVSSSSLWARVLPTIQLTGSIGLTGALFYDPGSGVLFPADSYRLTVSIPLHGFFTTWKHEEAVVRCRRVEVELAAARRAVAREQEGARGRLAALDAELRLLRAEQSILDQIACYNQLLFDQGTVTFDVLARAKLQALGAHRMILDRTSQSTELRSKYDLD